jgi:hypothetical protein
MAAPAFLDDSNTWTVVYVAGGRLPELLPPELLPLPPLDPAPPLLPPEPPLLLDPEPPLLLDPDPPPLPPPLLPAVPELLPDPAPDEVPVDAPELPLLPGGVFEPHAYAHAASKARGRRAVRAREVMEVPRAKVLGPRADRLVPHQMNIVTTLRGPRRLQWVVVLAQKSSKGARVGAWFTPIAGHCHGTIVSRTKVPFR